MAMITYSEPLKPTWHLPATPQWLYTITLLMYCVTICSSTASAQKNDTWYSFYKSKTMQTGYKDAAGKVKIAPRFGGLSVAHIFRNIVAVTDYDTGKSYHLLKNGRKVAKDSVYTWDMTYDYEQEGKIRFRDPKTDKVGYLGKNGKVVIPAVYNDAWQFNNGLAVVLYNGKRICHDGSIMDVKNPCEHWSWSGITALIDSNAQIVADSADFTKLEHIDWRTLQISDQPADTALRISIKGKRGYYSFVDYEKEFQQWFYQRYLTDDRNNNPRNLFDLVCVEGIFKDKLRKFYTAENFKAAYQTLLLKKLQRIRTGKIETQIGTGELNYMIFTQPAYRKYYADSGDANSVKYPLFDVITNHYGQDKQISYQEHFSFLRTENGYKLVEVAWKNRQ